MKQYYCFQNKKRYGIGRITYYVQHKGKVEKLQYKGVE